jgi:hypothetical protein
MQAPYAYQPVDDDDAAEGNENGNVLSTNERYSSRDLVQMH